MCAPRARALARTPFRGRPKGTVTSWANSRARASCPASFAWHASIVWRRSIGGFRFIASPARCLVIAFCVWATLSRTHHIAAARIFGVIDITLGPSLLFFVLSRALAPARRRERRGPPPPLALGSLALGGLSYGRGPARPLLHERLITPENPSAGDRWNWACWAKPICKKSWSCVNAITCRPPRRACPNGLSCAGASGRS